MVNRQRWWWATATAIVAFPIVTDVVSGASGQDSELVNVSVALGLVATSTIVLLLAPVSRLKGMSRAFGLRDSHDLHTLGGIAAALLVVAHAVVALATVPQGAGLLDVVDTTPAARAAVVSTVSLLLLATLVVPRVGRNRYVVRVRLHAVLAGIAILTAAAHIVLLFRLVTHPAMAVMFAALALVALACVGQRWVLRPLTGRGSYVVYGVRAEDPMVSTVVLVPTHLRHRLQFEPDQFVWLRMNRFPLTEEHPFPIASSTAKGRRVELTVRADDRCSVMVSQLERGRAVWLDGPYGDPGATSRPDLEARSGPSTGRSTETGRGQAEDPDAADQSQDGLICIGGGEGVTTIIDMLRSLSVAGDSRPVRVLLAEGPGEAPFPREVAVLERQLDLDVVRSGGRRVDAELLVDVLPVAAGMRWEYVVCGSGPFVDTAVAAVVDYGVPESRIHVERVG